MSAIVAFSFLKAGNLLTQQTDLILNCQASYFVATK